MTRVVCCYSTETESEAGDSARDQELVELLPAEGGISRATAPRARAQARSRALSGGDLRGAAAFGGAAGVEADDEYCDTSSDEDDGEDASRGAMMCPAAPPRSTAVDDGGGSPVRVLSRAMDALLGAERAAAPAQAQRIVQRLHERPQRRSRALARALAEAAAAPAVVQAAHPSGDAQTLMVPLYAPGADD